MRQNPSQKKIAVYTRKSRFTEKGDSVDVQKELCKSIAKAKDQSLQDDDFVFFEDEGYSGKNTARPDFLRMMSLVRQNALQEVICYRIDRISRNIIDFHAFTEDLLLHNVSFVSVTESCDTSTPMGRAMLSICSVFAQLERETIAERIRDNMMELAKSGRWLGGIPPTGYRSVQLVEQITESGKARKAYKLEVIPEEAALVKLIFQKFLEANSLAKVETFLMQSHIKTKNNKTFGRFSLRNILQNPVYAACDAAAWTYLESLGTVIHAEKQDFTGKHGIMVYNKTQQNNKQAHLLRNADEWVVAIGKHKPLISGEDWVRAQNLLQQNRSKAYRKPKSNTALLSGLLFCQHCGSHMRPKLSTRLNASGERIFHYLCETKEKSRMENCAMKNPLGNELDEMVCKALHAVPMNHPAFQQKITEARERIQRDSQAADATLESLRQKQQSNQAAIKQLVESLASAANTPAQPYINEEISRRHAQRKALAESIASLEKQITPQALDEPRFQLLCRQMLSVSLSLEAMSLEEKRDFLKQTIQKILWDGENAHVYFMHSNDAEPQRMDCK